MMMRACERSMVVLIEIPSRGIFLIAANKREWVSSGFPSAPSAGTDNGQPHFCARKDHIDRGTNVIAVHFVASAYKPPQHTSTYHA